jgi:hypothetical protein
LLVRNRKREIFICADEHSRVLFELRVQSDFLANEPEEFPSAHRPIVVRIRFPFQTFKQVIGKDTMTIAPFR